MISKLMRYSLMALLSLCSLVIYGEEDEGVVTWDQEVIEVRVPPGHKGAMVEWTGTATEGFSLISLEGHGKHLVVSSEVQHWASGGEVTVRGFLSTDDQLQIRTSRFASMHYKAESGEKGVMRLQVQSTKPAPYPDMPNNGGIYWYRENLPEDMTAIEWKQVPLVRVAQAEFAPVQVDLRNESAFEAKIVDQDKEVPILMIRPLVRERISTVLTIHTDSDQPGFQSQPIILGLR